MKRRFFVTVTYQATSMKSASVTIDGLRRSTPPSVRQTVEWNEELDALWDTPFLIFGRSSAVLYTRLHG